MLFTCLWCGHSVPTFSTDEQSYLHNVEFYFLDDLLCTWSGCYVVLETGSCALENPLPAEIDKEATARRLIVQRDTGCGSLKNQSTAQLHLNENQKRTIKESVRPFGAAIIILGRHFIGYTAKHIALVFGLQDDGSGEPADGAEDVYLARWSASLGIRSHF